MVKRRTLGEGLTPDEEEFLNSGKTVRKTTPKPKPTPPKEPTPMEIAVTQPAPVEQPQIQAIQVPPAAMFRPQLSVPGAMALNTRLSADISSALLTASMQRKIQRQEPFTQQGIVGEALTHWLKKNGFLEK